MKIGRGLSFYWDTCIFLHWLSDPVKDQGVLDGIEDIVKMSEHGDATIFTSTITRIEVLRSHLTPEAAEAFVKLFPRAVEWVNVDPRVAQLAHDIRDFYSEPGKRDMGTPDCIHLATAIVYGADEMHTLDGSGKPRRHDLIPLSGNVMGGKHKVIIRKPMRILPPPPVELPQPPLFALLDDAAGQALPDRTSDVEPTAADATVSTPTDDDASATTPTRANGKDMNSSPAEATVSTTEATQPVKPPKPSPLE